MLEYIRSSIEILMNMKTEEEKEQKEGGRSYRFPRDAEGAPSDFSSTFQSLDFAPKEYET